MNSSPVSAAESDPFSDLDVPPELDESLQRHRRHIMDLMLTLRSAGLAQEQIEASVSIMIASYKQELLDTIKRLMRERS